MGPKKGKLSIYFLRELNTEVKKVLKEDSIDNRIISVALNLKNKKNQTKEVILVSNDTNVRFKAASFGLKVESYQNDRVESLDEIYKGVVTVNSDESELNSLINIIYDTKEDVSIELLTPFVTTDILPNQYLILESTFNPSNKRSALCRVTEDGNKIKRVEGKKVYGRIEARNVEQKFAMDALLDKSLSLVTITGSAGTGKTLLAIAAAIEQANNYNQIFVARPIVAMSNKDLGYLPGDVQAKISPYMQPIWDNINFIKQASGGEQKKCSTKIDDLIETQKIIIEALAYIRGRTIPKSVFIVDEAQNLTPNEIKTLITRMGEGSKIVFTGDINQIDHPYLDAYSNGLTYLVEKSKNYSKAAHIKLEKGERSDLSDWAAKNL